MPGSFEPETIEIVSSKGSYPVHIGPNLIEQTLENATFGVLIADRRFATRLSQYGLPIIPIDVSESAKSISTCESIMVSMKELGLSRHSRVVAVGGGVVQDLVTLATSLYMRGIEWVYVPTTLMAMADSCIGGKSSINAGGVKNLIGNIYPPRAVVVDPSLAHSLDQISVACGLAEAVKIAYCRGAGSFARMTSLIDGWRDGIDLTGAIIESLKAKKWFIEIDEFDVAERQMLNFGHTFGHAIEAASGFALPHGIAVALGIRAALNFDGYSDSLEVQTLYSTCEDLSEDSLVEFLKLGKPLGRSEFMKAFESDKKHQGGMFSLILPAEGGGVRKALIPDSPRTRDEIWSAVSLLVEGRSPRA